MLLFGNEKTLNIKNADGSHIGRGRGGVPSRRQGLFHERKNVHLRTLSRDIYD